MTVLQSQRDVYQTTDKDVPLTLNFFVNALASDKFFCLASKQGFCWVRLTLRVLQRVAASAEDNSTTKESWWKKLVEHQKEHVRMDSRGYKGPFIRRKYDHITNLENQI